jgi:hypothetical protein
MKDISIGEVQNLLALPMQCSESDMMMLEFIFLTYMSDKPKFLPQKTALVDRYLARAEQAHEDAVMAVKILLGNGEVTVGNGKLTLSNPKFSRPKSDEGQSYLINRK